MTAPETLTAEYLAIYKRLDAAALPLTPPELSALALDLLKLVKAYE